eukprot:TRINITY_DN8790_c0_g1_i1.p1 TRINITY_DN8790_c0_g1~~TRINITY_DN8790_c0_g1_i1.p1  ORF type:complete len:115 (-),score=6.20 TRINITY_DN8790_c0_g1_i1:85-429(-)
MLKISYATYAIYTMLYYIVNIELRTGCRVATCRPTVSSKCLLQKVQNFLLVHAGMPGPRGSRWWAARILWPAAITQSLVECCTCLLYTSDAADEEDSVDLGGRRIIKKKKKKRE